MDWFRLFDHNGESNKRRRRKRRKRKTSEVQVNVASETEGDEILSTNEKEQISDEVRKYKLEK